MVCFFFFVFCLTPTGSISTLLRTVFITRFNFFRYFRLSNGNFWILRWKRLRFGPTLTETHCLFKNDLQREIFHLRWWLDCPKAPPPLHLDIFYKRQSVFKRVEGARWFTSHFNLNLPWFMWRPAVQTRSTVDGSADAIFKALLS